MTHPFWRTLLIVAVATAVSACSDTNDGPAPRAHHSVRPLQPLIYTERPDLSPAAAAVREHRLMRQLLDGSHAAGRWGRLDDRPAPRRRFADADQLGKAIFKALVDRDDQLWDTLFVAPADYAGMVRIELDDARQFVDDIQGKSRAVWRGFGTEHPSEVVQGGLGALLEFDGLELGDGRTVAGPVAGEGEEVAQYWGNVLRLHLKGTKVYFELRIPKVLRLVHPRQSPGQPTLALGSPVHMSPQLQVYLRAGLQLKPELLETREYPYPLAVGNFWRYRRKFAGTPDDPDKAAKAASRPAMAADAVAALDAATALPATETLLEVTSVDRYRSWRLVTLRRSYNDEKLSTFNEYWLVLPRRIYRCSHMCRVHIEDLSWLLSYLDRETPIFRFPLHLHEGWGEGGQPGDKDAVFKVGGDWTDVEVPAGTYVNTVAIHGTGPLAGLDHFYRDRQQTRFFAHGRGVVRRTLADPDKQDHTTVVEDLVESRILPR